EEQPDQPEGLQSPQQAEKNPEEGQPRRAADQDRANDVIGDEDDPHAISDQSGRPDHMPLGHHHRSADEDRDRQAEGDDGEQPADGTDQHRARQPGHAVELDTPAAAFTMERAGYYHAEVGADTTTFRTHRGGAATMTPS